MNPTTYSRTPEQVSAKPLQLTWRSVVFVPQTVVGKLVPRSMIRMAPMEGASQQSLTPVEETVRERPAQFVAFTAMK
jgi:hypothetical protein